MAFTHNLYIIQIKDNFSVKEESSFIESLFHLLLMICFSQKRCKIKEEKVSPMQKLFFGFVSYKTHLTIQMNSKEKRYEKKKQKDAIFPFHYYVCRANLFLNPAKSIC